MSMKDYREYSRTERAATYKSDAGSQAGRLNITAQYCASGCRQQENFSLSLSRPRVKACSAHIQRLLGYSIHAPFMGCVDGMHPKRLLED